MAHEPETRGHIIGFREQIRAARDESREAFFTWFDRSPDADSAPVRGAWDFAMHIARPLAGRIREPEKKTVLEIGYGGGRVLAAAARAFGRAVGVDIHDCGSTVLEELARLGVRNAELHCGDGRSLPVPDASVDVVYSFIVLQHVEHLAIHRALVAETARVLRPGGVAVLYHARLSRLSPHTTSRLRLALDWLIEQTIWRDRYREYPTHVNDINLRLSLPRAQSEAHAAGLACEAVYVSRRRLPDGFRSFGEQFGLVLRKPA